ncbi:hypothetical protein SeMB42_g05328 [Synchytrium endobioticum]|uniref:NAD-dependent epimerase/dehydratase domain-containing protein n=1 Tax=Synchytrium endobioticum TaxID=286115 RepID=A0A507CS31_9FUNG|nr:hypothetical protein SeMB42_g05328 [Synchytrium endobioticum]
MKRQPLSRGERSLGLEHGAQDPVLPAPSDWYFQPYLRTFGRNMMPPNTPTTPDDLAEGIFPNLQISVRQLEVVWSIVYQVLLRLGDANRLPFCSSVFNAGDLKLNRFLGLHSFLLQAISSRDCIVSETDEVPGVKPSKGFARAKVMEIWEHVHADDTESPVQDRILSKRFHSQVTHLLYKAWRDFALVENGIEQGLRLLRDEDKDLKWTKKSQFVSDGSPTGMLEAIVFNFQFARKRDSIFPNTPLTFATIVTMLIAASNATQLPRTASKAANLSLFHLSRRGAHDVVKREGSKHVFVRQGPGGRSSVSGHTATVFGCTGFLGRYLVNNLGKRGTTVVIPYRGNDDAKRHLKLMGDLGQIVPLRFDVRDEQSVAECVRHSDVVYNLIGRDYETKNFTYEQVHVDAARRIATIARDQGVSRLIHVSALNANASSPSKFLRSKALGEDAVLSEFPDATIVRPATCYGYEDRFLNRLGWYMVWPPFFPIPGRGKARIRPVYGPDVALVLARLLNDAQSYASIVELPGPTEFYYYSFVKMFCEICRRDPMIVYLPKTIAKIVPMLMDKLMAFPIDVPDNIERLCISDSSSESSLSWSDYGVQPHTIYEAIGQFARLFVPHEYQNAPLNIPRGHSTDAVTTPGSL